MPEVTTVGIQGATGRMGVRLVRLTHDDPQLRLGAALVRPDHPHLGQDLGPLIGLGRYNIPLASALPAESRVDVMIDFSHPSGTLKLARDCQARNIPLVVGTTGFEPNQLAELREYGRSIPMLISPNMSRAVNLWIYLTGLAAQSLKGIADIEIVERHHKQKKDAPSGTALRAAEVLAEASGNHKLVHGRQGQVGARPTQEIGIHAVRGGDNPGEHTAIFAMMGEVLELTHRAYTRDSFARGALDAAKFLVGKPPGCYSMNDLLNLDGYRA